ncbi:MAG TPA: alpha/beta fold hydrolase, partial [Stenotrophobium sp.]|jgi:alpha/beta superfamily hydrolase|nr:alpha/beta fold hydrolase [Stenotrophobium sp.]
MMDDDAPLPVPGATAPLRVYGPAGRIELLLSAPREPATRPGFAVVCHPHPLFGGAMSNKVVYTLAACATQAGLYALRFNFRGVGYSEGVHDRGRGETEDVLFLVNWMRQRLPQAPLLLAGFSFGAFVSVKAAAAAKPAVQVSVAPPFEKYVDEPVPPRPDCPWLVLHGTADDVVDYAQTRRVLQTFSPPPELVTVEGAGHFFHGRLDVIRDAAVPFIAEHWPRPD